MQKRVDISRIIYGTAKLGDSSYGLSKDNKLTTDERVNLLNDILELGITRFDTSPKYKEAEKYLGEIISKSKINILVDSKIVDLRPNDVKNEKFIIQQVEKSIKKLRIRNLNVLYLHQNELEILSDKYVQRGLKKVLDLGLSKKIGISVYNHTELDYGINSELFDVIQAPINILNDSFFRRFKRKNKFSNKELVARSIFIQGALFSKNSNGIEKLNLELHKKIKFLKSICEENKTTIENEAKYSVFKLSNLSVIQSSLSIDNIKSNTTYNLNKYNSIVQEQIKVMKDTEYSYTNPRNWKI